MKALIICSVHAVCDIAPMERDAFNAACATHGVSARLTSEDHTRILANATMLDVLNHLPGSKCQRKMLVTSYLDTLNDHIWSASVPAHKSTFATLLDPNGHTRPTGFVSDYPLLTSNLVRSAALLTNATKLGHLTTLADPLNVQSSAAGLAASAASLNVNHSDVEVLVAYQRDFEAARSLGMESRFIAERPPITASGKRHREHTRPFPVGALLGGMPNHQPLKIVA
ncbi:MAG: hypothetical protein AAF718_01285 [Pseudomonadota bacterium]